MTTTKTPRPFSSYSRPSADVRSSFTQRRRAPLWVEILGVVIGIPWAGFFAWCLYVELATPPRHADHATLFFFGFMIGACVALGRWFLFPVFQNVIVLYGDFRAGGRRRGDRVVEDFIRPDDEERQ